MIDDKKVCQLWVNIGSFRNDFCEKDAVGYREIAKYPINDEKRLSIRKTWVCKEHLEDPDIKTVITWTKF